MGFITGNPNLGGAGSVVPSRTGGFVVGDPNLNGNGSPTSNIPTTVITPNSTTGFTGSPELNGSNGTAQVSGNGNGSSGTAPASANASTLTGLPISAGGAVASNVTVPPDFRARLTALHPEDVYKPGLLHRLAATGGVLFPYTPTIAFSQAVNYADLQLVHSNTDYPSYTRTPSVTLNVTGKFTVQNQHEGLYALAVIHFLRAVSKSYFGETDAASGKAGLPPPVLVFSAYGPYMYNRLRVILKSHSWTFDENMDTIAVIVGSVNGQSAQVRLPAVFSITTELMVVQTPQRMRKLFSFDAFASGAMMNPATSNGGWI